MSVMLDLIGSAVLGAFVLLLGLRLNQTARFTSDAARADLNVQETLVDIVGTLEYDFRKIGYKVVDPKKAIIFADTTRIRFTCDIDNSGAIDTIEWFLGAPFTVTSGTLPPKTYYPLGRKVNNGVAVSAAGLGVTKFGLIYRDVDGALVKGTSPQYPVPSANLSKIWIIETTLQVESMYKVADQIRMAERYTDTDVVNAVAFWRQTRLASRNIKRHG